MPPKAPSSAPRAGRGRGGPPRGGPQRGGPSIRGSSSTSGVAPSVGLPSTADHVTTVGVKRPSFGNAGTQVQAWTNHYATEIPDGQIYHYDVVIDPSEKKLPPRLNLMIISTLQNEIAPNVFARKAVYDGRKNMFASVELAFGNYAEFEVMLPATRDAQSRSDDSEANTERARKPYTVKLTKVAVINPETLQRFLEGKQSHDNSVLTAITALNVVVRMDPSLKYTFNVRSFFTSRETLDLKDGIELWRGYFQSLRPGIGRMLINIDISTGAMYKSGRLLDVCCQFLDIPGQFDRIAPRSGLPDRERMRLQRYTFGIRVEVIRSDGKPNGAPRVIKRLSTQGAADTNFALRDGGKMSVANYFHQSRNAPLRYPNVICAEVGSGALLPLELCYVTPGQIMRKQVPQDKTADVLKFATKPPADRLQSIKQGLSVMNYGQSEYLRSFNMHVDESGGPLKVIARVLDPPLLKYGATSRPPTVKPANGQWNMVGKKYYRPASIAQWIIVCFEREQRFNRQSVMRVRDGLAVAADEVGVKIQDHDPIISYADAQRPVTETLMGKGNECRQRKGVLPTLIVIILPEGGADVYTQIKHFGDVMVGVATQCLKSSKCFKAKEQYYSNVMLKINVKLGGINTIPEPRSATILTDPTNPAIIMGADVIHPAPGSEGRPSFTSLVGNVDSDAAKYVAESRVQTSRQEIIDDLKEMSKALLSKYMAYRTNFEKKPSAAPKRLILFRDGVSEGQFRHVLDSELPLIQEACRELNITPKITVVVVGKRHHVRFFPTRPDQGDRSGNCQAGTVIDQDIGHPTEFDFFLLSHGGLLGTSRPAHYSVLYDENKFSADDLQSLSFALCHVYARSTRSVSIPAPVYYADIVCARAKNHYDPADRSIGFSDTATQTADGEQASSVLEAYKRGFKPLHANMSRVMYFS